MQQLKVLSDIIEESSNAVVVKRNKNPGLTFFSGHSLVNEQKDKAENKHIDADVLRDCAALVNRPPPRFVRIIIAKKFYEESVY